MLINLDVVSISTFFSKTVRNADKNELKENEAIVAIGIQDKSIYKIQWTASDKTKKVDSITITMTDTLKKTKSHRESLYKKYSGVRIQNK